MPSPTDAALGDWVDRELTVARRRRDLLGDKGALPTLAKELRAIDPSSFFREKPVVFQALSDAEEPAATAVLAAYFARPLPADTDHAALIGKLQWARANPAVRSFLLARLNDRSRSGGLRICDAYANNLAKAASVTFSSTDPVPTRDAAIAKIRNWVAAS